MSLARFTKAARAELLAQTAYYEKISAGLGARFRSEVEAAAQRAATFPLHGKPSSGGTRRRLIADFPPIRGGMVAGVPSAHAAPAVTAHIAPSADPPPVWPSIEGKVRGIALIPLYPSAPVAALKNATLYELLALFDARL